MDALAIRTHWYTDIARAWMLWPFARTGNTDVLIGRTWMLWPLSTRWQHGRSHRASMDALAIRTHWYTDFARACMLWPFVRTGNTDVLLVWAWMLWPFARTGNTDVLIVRAWMLWPFARPGNTDVLINGCSGHLALVTRTFSSCGHGCSGILTR